MSHVVDVGQISWVDSYSHFAPFRGCSVTYACYVCVMAEVSIEQHVIMTCDSYFSTLKISKRMAKGGSSFCLFIVEKLKGKMSMAAGGSDCCAACSCCNLGWSC